MLAHIRNSVGRKRNRKGKKKKSPPPGFAAITSPKASARSSGNNNTPTAHGHAHGPRALASGRRSPASPNPARKQRSRHSYASSASTHGGRKSKGIESSLEVAFSSLSLEEQQQQLERCAHFKRNLGKLLRAHDHNWRKVPFFFFVDEWISDEGKTITKNRLRKAEAARRKFGIAN